MTYSRIDDKQVRVYTEIGGCEVIVQSLLSCV